MRTCGSFSDGPHIFLSSEAPLACSSLSIFRYGLSPENGHCFFNGPLRFSKRSGIVENDGALNGVSLETLHPKEGAWGHRSSGEKSVSAYWAGRRTSRSSFRGRRSPLGLSSSYHRSWTCARICASYTARTFAWTSEERGGRSLARTLSSTWSGRLPPGMAQVTPS